VDGSLDAIGYERDLWRYAAFDGVILALEERELGIA
jgi:hypothetical protein